MNTLSAIALAFLAAASDGDVTASVRLAPPVIPFHRQATFTLVVEAPSDVEPQIADRFGGLGIYGTPSRDVTTLRGGRKRITETYVLDPVFVGQYPLGPVEVTWGDGQRLVIPCPALRVRDLTPEETEEAMRFEPIAGAISPGIPTWKDWRLWLAGGMAAALSAAGGWYLLRQRGKKSIEAPPAPPWEVAYDRLRQLDERHLPESGRFETFYVDLSSILRYYIEDRFELHAPERTTPEFLAEARDSEVLSEAHQRVLANLLRHCDLVKFARYRPSVEDMEKGLSAVIRFVDETVPREEVAPEAAA